MVGKPNLSALLDSVTALGDYEFENEGERRKAMAIARASTSKLESNYDRIIDMWARTATDAAIKTLIDVDAFTKWIKTTSKQSSMQVAVMTGIQPALMASLLRHLAAMNVLEEEGPDLYSLNEFSKALSRPEVAACVSLQVELFLPAFASMPEFFESLHYERPQSAKRAAFAFAFKFDGSIFDYMKSHPKTAQDYQQTNVGFNRNRPGWIDVYHPEKLLPNYDPNTTLLVDIGGGLGNDILKLQGVLPKHLQSSERLVLQDQPSVLDNVSSTAITKMPHDFFKEQPVTAPSATSLAPLALRYGITSCPPQDLSEFAIECSVIGPIALKISSHSPLPGARAYFLHSITHDWPEDDVRTILSAIKPAMKPGYSRILIYDNIIAETGADVQTTSFDLIMMAMQGGKERTAQQFHALIESIGLKIVGIHSSAVAAESLIEVDLA